MGARAGRLGDATGWRHAKKTVVRAVMVQLPPPVLLLVFRGSPGQVASRMPRPLVLRAASRKGRERERGEKEKGVAVVVVAAVVALINTSRETVPPLQTVAPPARGGGYSACLGGGGDTTAVWTEKTRTRNRRQQDPMPMSYILAC